MPEQWDDELTAAIMAPPPPQGAPLPPGMPPPMVAPPPPNGLRLPDGWNPGEAESRLDLRVRLTPDKRADTGVWLTTEIGYYKEAWGDRRAMAQDWRDAAAMMPNWPLTDPRGGGGDQGQTTWMSWLRFPGTRLAVQSFTQALTQQFLSQDPAFVAIPQQVMWSPLSDAADAPQMPGFTENLVTRAPDAERALQSLLEKADWKSRCRELFDEIGRVCPAALYVGRRRESVWVLEGLGEFDDEVFEGLVETGEVAPFDAYQEATATDAQGRPRVRRSWREEVTHDGIEWRVVPYEEFIALPAKARHEQDTFAMGEWRTLKASEARRLAADRLSGYYRDALLELMERPSDPLDDDESNQYDRDGYQGDQVTATDRPEYRQWRVVDLALKGTLDGDHREKWYWVTVHPATQTLLRCVYILDKHGACPYIPFNAIGAKLVGESVAELNSVLQSSADKIACDMIDLLSIMTGCGGSVLVQEGSYINLDELVFRPGTAMRVLDVNGIKHLPLPDNIPAVLNYGMQLLRYLFDLTQLVTATSNLSLGQQSEGETTATEATMVFRQDAAIRESNALTIGLQLGKAARLTAQLEAQCCKDASYKWMERAEGGLSEKEIDPRLLGAPYQWMPAGLSASSSAQVRYQKAMTLMQLAQTNQFLAPVVEIQLEALEEVLQALGQQDYRQWMEMIKRRLALMVAAEQAGALQAEQAGAEEAASGEEAAAAEAGLQMHAMEREDAQAAAANAGKNGGATRKPGGAKTLPVRSVLDG